MSLANKTNRILGIMMAFVLALTLAACGSSETPKSDGDKDREAVVETAESEPEPEAEPEPEPEPEPAPEVKSVYEVGDTLDDGGLEIVYIASGEHVEDNEFLQPSEGNKYVFFKFAFINNSNSVMGVSSFSFEAYADGYATDMYFGGENDLSATLSPGRSTVGYIYFEVPVDAEEIEVEYTPGFYSDKITFAYGGEQDSGYELEPNTGRTEGALAVGESAEGTGLTVTYVSCEPYTSDNMFIQPAAGCHFVTLSFEFENTGSSDQFLSSLSFDCYADGVACNPTFIRDDDLSATISAGRKAAGTVTFEVPDDATVIEVEYEDNIWTSSRIVFTVQ